MKKVTRFLKIGLLSFGLVALAAGTLPAQMKQIPLEDFFRNPEKNSYTISPNGEYYAYLAPFQNRMNIHVQKIGSADVTRTTKVTDRDIAGFFWANDNRLIYIKDNGGDENYALYAVDRDGGNFKALTEFEGVVTRIIDDLEDIPNEIIIGLNKRNPQIFDPYRLDITSGQMEILFENPGNISGWMTDHEGKLRVATTTNGVTTSVMHREKETDEFKVILTTNFKESANPVFFTFDNKNLYAISNVGRDKAAAVVIDAQTGKELEKIYEHPDVDVSSLSYSRKRKVLTSVRYTTDKAKRHFLDKESETWYNKLAAQLKGYELGFSGISKDENKLIVRTYSDRSLGAYYIYNKATNELTKIEDVSPWLNEDDMAEMKAITYKSRDGLTIHGYLTLPKGSSGKNLPVVVNPHGGPWARDNWGFNPEIQFLANRGYAVLQMNFRGSTGYGRAFWEASFNQWGRAMQEDITDGVNWLIKQGIADPERIAIYGGSYGGYATLMGLVKDPDLYACGIDYVGVSNLFSFMETIPPYWKPYLEMMYEMVGDPNEDKERMEATSPALQAEKIKSPLFIAQGAKDPRVNKDESDQMVEAMRKRGVEVEYLVKENEGHGFRNEENRFEFYGAMEKFLAQHMK